MTCSQIAPCITSVMMLFMIFISVPICCYSTYWFYKYRNHQHIQPRYPSFIIILSIVSIITILTKDISLYIILLTDNTLSLINTIFEPFSLALSLGMLIRVWLINYDINYTVWQAQHKWQSLLQNEIKLDDNWYALNKHKYGNWKYMFLIASIFFIIASTIIIAINNYFYSQLITLILLYIITLFNFSIILCKIPSFNDQVFIRKEVTLIIYINIICIGLYFILALITYSILGLHDTFAIIINNIILTIYNISIPFLSTFWVIYKFTKNDIIVIDEIPLHGRNSPYTLGNTQSNLTLTIHKSSPSRVATNTPNQHYISPNKLFRIVLKNDLALSCFMEHLQAEFSIENVLSFIELVQWLQQVTDQNWDDYDIKPLYVSFADSVPISSINKDPTTTWFNKINKLNDKYIAEHCEYEVNIPYGLRSAMRNLISLMSQQEQRMANIMNKKEIRRRTATNSSQPQHSYQIASNSSRTTRTITQSTTINTINSTAITSTLSSTNTRKSRGVSATTTATKSSQPGPDTLTLNNNQNSSLAVPRQPSNSTKFVHNNSNKNINAPITPYLGPSVPNINENDSNNVNDEFEMITEDNDESGDDGFVVMSGYSEYKSPKKQQQTPSIVPVNNPKMIDVRSHSDDEKKNNENKKEKLAIRRHVSNNLLPISDSKKNKKKLKLQKAESLPGLNMKGTKSDVFLVKISKNEELVEDKLSDDVKDNDNELQFDELQLDDENETKSSNNLPLPKLNAAAHSFDATKSSGNKKKLPFRNFASANPTHTFAKSSDGIRGKYNTPKKVKMSHIAARVSARFSSFGLFSKNSISPNNIETDLAEKIDDERKESTPKPKEVGLKDFIHIVNEIVMVVQSLNHQSISRWRKTKEFSNLNTKVDLNQLAAHISTPTINVNANNNLTIASMDNNNSNASVSRTPSSIQ